MKKTNDEKFAPGSDYWKIRFLADELGDTYTAWGNGLIIPAWEKRFTFDGDTGDLVKVQRITSSGSYKLLGDADDMVIFELARFSEIINRWAHDSGDTAEVAGDNAYRDALRETESKVSKPFSIPPRTMFVCAIQGLRDASNKRCVAP